MFRALRDNSDKYSTKVNNSNNTGNTTCYYMGTIEGIDFFVDNHQHESDKRVKVVRLTDYEKVLEAHPVNICVIDKHNFLS